jgi:hypothetical protein
MKPNIDCDPFPWLARRKRSSMRGLRRNRSAPGRRNIPDAKFHESVIKVNVAQLPVTLN